VKDTDTHINTLRVQAPEEAARQVRLRLSTTLGGADLHPSGLAPSEMLLVRTLEDPEPGRLGVENAGAMLDRTWERAVRDALNDCLRRAVRPTNGRVPPDADAVLFRDEAEAWACWSRVQGDAGTSTVPWWTESLEASSDAPASPAGRSPSVAAVWRARPRLVPAIAAHLATWNDALEVVRQMTETEAEDILRSACTAFNAPPTPQALHDRADDQDLTFRPASSELDEQRETDGCPPEKRNPETPFVPTEGPPWTSFVEEAAGARLADALTQASPAHRQLLGVALALRDRPVTVRSRAFQAAWQAWRQAVEEPPGPSELLAEEEGAPDRPASGSEGPDDPEGKGRSSRAEAPSGQEDASTGTDAPVKEDASLVDHLALDDQQVREETASSTGEREKPPWQGAHATTELGGVLYLVNVLDALNLPDVVETPPVGEHVGAWAVLEVLGRALLGPNEDALRPDDPLWRVLAILDGRRPKTPAGQPLADTEPSSQAYRIPSGWLKAPHVEPPIEGGWAVKNGRLRVWTEFGCVADVEAGDDPAAQAEAEWNRVPNTGSLQHASADAMPLSPEPADCAPALARWAARTSPYVRHRLAAALGVDDPEAGWVADLFRAEGRLYTTDVNADLVLPLDAARIDARAAGLDRSPGWWPAGGRIVRFHFREADV
jgi:hypothetical protein